MAIEPDRLPLPLHERIAAWDGLRRWERRELGRDLRSLGLSYREIGSIIPVSKETLSGWCRDLPLTEAQSERLARIRPNLAAARRAADRRRQEATRRREHARSAGSAEAAALLREPLFVAGVVAYWAEGAKRDHRLKFSNSDARMVRLFIAWVERFLMIPAKDLTIALHLHSGQDEAERRRYWARETGLAPDQFRATFVKAAGTGHRKNNLYQGTATIVVRKSGILLPRVLGWIDAVAATYGPLAQLARASDS